MLVSNRWRTMIVRDLLDGTKRFGELKRTVTGISQKVRTSNLRAMEEAGIVSREIFAEVPPRVERYVSTEDSPDDAQFIRH